MAHEPHPPEAQEEALETQLDRASSLCEARGVKLTELRRQVLALILSAGRPVGAYDLLDQLRSQRRGAAPPTVYRALDFLLEHGLVHKIERLSAYVGCPVHDHHAHAAQFLICTRCGAVQELEDPAIRAALETAASRRGFHIAGITVEAEGVCTRCAETASVPMA